MCKLNRFIFPIPVPSGLERLLKNGAPSPPFSWPSKCNLILPLLVFTPSPCQLFQTSFSPPAECVFQLLSLPSPLSPSLQGPRSQCLVPNYHPENCLCQKRVSFCCIISLSSRERKKDFQSRKARREAQDLRRAPRPAGRLVPQT